MVMIDTQMEDQFIRTEQHISQKKGSQKKAPGKLVEKDVLNHALQTYYISFNNRIEFNG